MNDDCFLCTQAGAIGRFGHLAIFANAYPITQNHLVLGTDEHHPVPSRADIDAMRRFVSLGAWPTLGWMNLDGAGASLPEHNHYQACVEVPLLADALIWHATRSVIGRRDERVLSMVTDYPVPGLSARGADAAGLVLEIAVALGARPYNLLFMDSEVLVFPRGMESPPQFPDRRFAGLELAGCIVLENDSGPLEAISGEACWQALRDSGIDKMELDDFCDTLLATWRNDAHDA